MKTYFVLILFFIPFSLFSQKAAETKDSTDKKCWIANGVAGFNVSQIAFENWTQGGDNSVTYSVTGNFRFDCEKEDWAFKNNLKLAYGQTKLGDANFKTNDNEFYLENVFSKKVGWAVDPYFSNTTRTILTPGFKDVNGKEVKSAQFFDPGYITQSLGFTYDKSKVIKTRLGAALQETFTSKFPSYSDDPDTQDELETFKLETGLESVTDVEYGFMENMLLKSKLRLFTRFDALDVWDVRWDNTITAKINSLINVNLNVLVIYEKAQSPKTQLKQALQLGVTFNLFKY